MTTLREGTNARPRLSIRRDGVALAGLVAALVGAACEDGLAGREAAREDSAPQEAASDDSAPHAAAGDAAVPREDAWRERGAAAVAALKQQLMGELSAALAQGGPENAIEVCRVRAPAIAQAASGPRMRVGRTSHKLRNPANAPPDWVAPLLARHVAGELGNEASVVDLGDGRGGYVEPLVTAPMCLVCHGESLAPALEARLRTLYPEDRAVGFRAGELRGLAWVEFED
jgi:hypothetical protein